MGRTVLRVILSLGVPFDVLLMTCQVLPALSKPCAAGHHKTFTR
ncbi:hypothetical protein CGRA01v4_07111 [Colletotrichum graminicola]|nr:hypothetical protein CGRA01v4_07111 [Colletotrichum graminicola]